MEPAIEITEAMRIAIAEAANIEIARRYHAYFDPAQVQDGKYIIIAHDEERVSKRGFAQCDYTIDFGFQIALPRSSAEYPDPLDNNEWLDEQLEKMTAIKLLFDPTEEPDAPLRDQSFAGATFLRMTHSPLVRLDMLRDHQIFCSALRFVMRRNFD